MIGLETNNTYRFNYELSSYKEEKNKLSEKMKEHIGLQDPDYFVSSIKIGKSEEKEKFYLSYQDKKINSKNPFIQIYSLNDEYRIYFEFNMYNVKIDKLEDMLEKRKIIATNFINSQFYQIMLDDPKISELYKPKKQIASNEIMDKRIDRFNNYISKLTISENEKKERIERTIKNIIDSESSNRFHLTYSFKISDEIFTKKFVETIKQFEEIFYHD